MPPDSGKLRLSGTVVATIHATTRAALPEEGCGYLIAKASSPERVLEAVSARNVHPGPRHSRYLVEPQEFLALDARLESEDRAIVGIFHSHPSSAAVPSPTDLGAALPDLYYVIHDARDGRMGALRAWRLDVAGKAFEEMGLVVDG